MLSRIIQNLSSIFDPKNQNWCFQDHPGSEKHFLIKNKNKIKTGAWTLLRTSWICFIHSSHFTSQWSTGERLNYLEICWYVNLMSVGLVSGMVVLKVCEFGARNVILRTYGIVSGFVVGPCWEYLLVSALSKISQSSVHTTVKIKTRLDSNFPR